MGLDTPKSTPKITVVDANDVETSHVFDKFTRAFQITCNGDEDVHYSWESGQTASGDFVLLRSGLAKWDDLVLLSEGQTIYLLAPNVASPSTVGVSIEEWR